MSAVINLNPAKVTRLQKAVAYLRRTPKYRSLASLLATMRIVETEAIPTACTDSVSFVKVNPQFIETLDTLTAASGLAHETLHKFNLYHLRLDVWRKKHPNIPLRTLAMVFNFAQDYLINYSLKHDWGLPLGEGWLYDPQYNMQTYTTEALADKLLREQASQPSGSGGAGGEGEGDESQQGEGSGGDGGDSESDPSGQGSGKGDTSEGDNPFGGGGLEDGLDVEAPPTDDPEGAFRELTENERQELKAKVQRDIASAVRSSKGIGVDDSDFFHKQMASAIKAPTASLAKELRRLASELDRSGHTSWMTPSRRRKLPSGLPMPGPRDTKLGTLVFVIDTSGSTSGETVQYFMNTAVETLKNVNFKEVVVLHSDTSVKKVFRYTKRDFVTGKVDLNLYGGGGTRFRPAFQWVLDNIRGKVTAMVYLTDGGTMHSDVMECARLTQKKRYPVLWALYSTWPCVETFINWVTVDQKFGRVSRLPEDKAG